MFSSSADSFWGKWARRFSDKPGKGKGRQTAKAPRRVRLQCEALEDRSVPSVVANLSGNTLTISDPDTIGHGITVSQTKTQGQITVQVDSLPVQTFKGVANITANLGAGSDKLNFNTVKGATPISGNINVTQGDGQDGVQFNSTTVTGSVSVSQGNHNTDTVDFDSVTIGGNALVTQGNGILDVIGTYATAGPCHFGGNVTLIQGDGRGASVQFFFASTVVGYMSVTQGNGNNDGVTLDFATVGGSLSVTQGRGLPDAVYFESVTVNGNVSLTQDQVLVYSASGPITFANSGWRHQAP